MLFNILITNGMQLNIVQRFASVIFIVIPIKEHYFNLDVLQKVLCWAFPALWLSLPTAVVPLA